MTASATFGLVFFGLLLTWIGRFGAPAFVALTLLETALTTAALSIGAWVFRGKKKMWLIGFPVALLAGEYLRSIFPFGGFGWGGLGYSQHANLVWLRLAPYAGVWGLTFGIAAINGLLAAALSRPVERKRVGALLVLVLVLAVFPVGLRGGALEKGTPVTVGVVQGSVPENTVDPTVDDAELFDRQVALTRKLAQQDPALVVWPESSFDRDPLVDPVISSRLQKTIRNANSHFLIGANINEPGAGDMRLNASLFFNPRGSLEGTYAKQKLVPFGETVPFRRVLEPLISQLDRVPYDTEPGNTSRVFAIPEGNFASVICYESTFPALVRSFVNNGARMIIVSTNNSSYGRSAASAQHLAFSQLRAAEHRTWVVHAALSGISGVINPEGRLLGKTKLFETTSLAPVVRFATGVTPFARMGDWLPISALVFLFGVSLSRARRALRETEITITFKERARGRSKMSNRTRLEEGNKTLIGFNRLVSLATAIALIWVLTPISAYAQNNDLCKLLNIDCPPLLPTPTPTVAPTPTPNLPRPTPQVFVPQAPPPAPSPSPSPSRRPTRSASSAPVTREPPAPAIDAIDPQSLETAPSSSQPDLSAPELPALERAQGEGIFSPALVAGALFLLLLMTAFGLGFFRHQARVGKKLSRQDRIFGAVQDLKTNLNTGQSRVGSW